MKLSEIESGELNNPNIPVFGNPKHECDIDGYEIMSDMWNGYYVLGILDDKNIPKSYVILEPENNGTNKLREIYTNPLYRGKNLASTILLCLKGKLNIRLLLAHDEVVSQDARKLILNMVKNGRLTAALSDGSPISTDNLEDIFSKFGKTDYDIFLESQSFMDWERRYRKDEILSERWRLRNNSNELYD